MNIIKIMELKAQDLRIGNWLRFDNMISEPYNYQVSPRMFRQMGYDISDNLDLKINNYHKPIPIEKDILLKCGGEINRKLPGIKVDRFRLIWKESYNYWYVIDNQTQTYLTKLEFVHEFQNFMYVMNGNELTINL